MYALGQAFRALKSNWVASVATLATMILSLTILTGFSLLTLNLNEVLADLQNDLEVTAFLEPTADHLILLSTIQNWPETSRVSYTPLEQGLAELEASIPSVGQAAELVGNPLPNRIDIQLIDPSLTLQVRQKLEGLSGISDILDGATEASAFLAINRSVRLTGMILIMILLLTSLFATVNSVRAAISTRKDEIEVMRLVGASSNFIRSPFLLEGFLLGLISAVVTFLLAIPGYQYIVGQFSRDLPFIPLVRSGNLMVQVTALLFVLALLVGLVGSAIAVSQYLRESR